METYSTIRAVASRVLTVNLPLPIFVIDLTGPKLTVLLKPQNILSLSFWLHLNLFLCSSFLWKHFLYVENTAWKFVFYVILTLNDPGDPWFPYFLLHGVVYEVLHPVMAQARLRSFSSLTSAIHLLCRSY